MALSRALFLFALIATIFSTMVVAKDFVVGDEKGWRLGVDYQSWAANKVFHVADTLTFNYVAGEDNVVRVNESHFQSCSIPLTSPVLTSGHDTMLFTTTGKRWYVPGFSDHCSLGQKLVITVQQSSSQLAWSPIPSASPSPTPSSPIPAPEAVASDELWSPVPSPSASLSPSPSPTPADEVGSSDATWTAPRRSLLPKKLFKMIHRNLIRV
ncbi:blue copper protein 1a [Trifolium repens]|nr:blue copper protein 1a [Trifolium repens]